MGAFSSISVYIMVSFSMKDTLSIRTCYLCPESYQHINNLQVVSRSV